jgi:CDP-2,3-bis-(O-geranylgeranyl)-sn-glycerol synthase
MTRRRKGSPGRDRHAALSPVMTMILLIAAANVAPLAATRLLGRRWAWRLDAGMAMPDGRPRLGSSKTWRGCAASLLTLLLIARPLETAPSVAARLSLLSMMGDAAASFLKRRMGIEVHARSRWLDPIPEVLLPALVLQRALGLTRREVAEAVFVFAVLEEPWSRLFFRLGLRTRPF